jgi:penicillin-insensitive murein endopeptidase
MEHVLAKKKRVSFFVILIFLGNSCWGESVAQLAQTEQALGVRFSAGLLMALCAVAHGEPASPSVWGAVRTPTPGAGEAIGGYSAGCLQGASRLPIIGDGFRVTRPERQRVWGHPSLVAFLKQLAGQLKKHKLPTLFIGDMAQPRGGPAPSGHASHQTGLDVDLAYVEPRDGKPPSVLDAKKQRPGKLFSARVIQLLKLAAADPRVDRIFVHPAIKRALCEGGGDWLHKLRPWWGHHDHFHVRLACPPGSGACQSQAELPEGDGCAEVAWWFSPAATADRDSAHDAYSAKVGAGPELPERCNEVLAADANSVGMIR